MDFVFAKEIDNGATATYRRYYDRSESIILCPKKILECNKMIDDEKTTLMAWQIEHEMLHATLYNFIGVRACRGLDKTKIYISNVCEPSKLKRILKKIGWIYN